MRPYPDRRHHACPVPGTLPVVDHHRVRRIVPDQGVAAAKIINFSLPYKPTSVSSYLKFNI